MKIIIDDIRRHGKTILLGQGMTATEHYGCGLPELTIRHNGKLVHKYRGSSLYFGRVLTLEDKTYLASLAE